MNPTLLQLARERFPGVDSTHLTRVFHLLQSDHTVPFIVRYRREQCGNMDEQMIRQLQQLITSHEQVSKKQQSIIDTLTKSQQLTPTLRQQILNTTNLASLNDLYAPFKTAKSTYATEAEANGLTPLADAIRNEVTLNNDSTLEAEAEKYRNQALKQTKQVLNDVKYLLAHTCAFTPAIRSHVREHYLKYAVICSRVKKSAEKQSQQTNNKEIYTFSNYFDFRRPVSQVQPHQIMALLRGETKKFLTLTIELPRQNDYINSVIEQFVSTCSQPVEGRRRKIIKDSVLDSFERLLEPYATRQVRKTLTTQAHTVAARVFGTNLQSWMLCRPVINSIILAIDPGFKNGCKLAIVDQLSNIKWTGVLYPHPPENKRKEAIQLLTQLITQHSVNIVAIGNGTASNETRTMILELLQQVNNERTKPVHFTMVNEAGSSVYSVSPVASVELAEYTPPVRSAITLARRLLDPISELVKVEPLQNIGIGMYQHDVDDKLLEQETQQRVEHCVNLIGVDVNIASVQLLQYIAGLTKARAEAIVAHRQQFGRFRSRQQLLEVRGIGPKTFEQAAGFLRIYNGNNCLDATSIHPENYERVGKLLRHWELSLSQLYTPQFRQQLDNKVNEQKHRLEQLAASFEFAGVKTLEDVFHALREPERDIRQQFDSPLLQSTVPTFSPSLVGQVLTGTVQNVLDFGVFIDLGMEESGLIHRTDLLPNEQVYDYTFGSIVSVRVKSIDMDRRRIACSRQLVVTDEQRKLEQEREQKQMNTGKSAAAAVHSSNKRKLSNKSHSIKKRSKPSVTKKHSKSSATKAKRNTTTHKHTHKR